MVKRKIIKIVEEKCNGCGQCIPYCPEGALQVIDGKARIISDIFCDGLGACIGYCPQGAINTEEREAELYDEKKVMKNIVKAGKKTIIAHLKHLKEHNEIGYLKEALEVLRDKEIDVDFSIDASVRETKYSCPGAKMMDFSEEKTNTPDELGRRMSQLKQWPIQLHLVPTNAPYYKKKNVLLVADCVGYSLADFHKIFLKDRSIAIACPKLDSNIDLYIEKITELIDDAKINSLTVMTMEVPCCNGLLQFTRKATEKAKRKIPLVHIIVSIKGEILKKEKL